MSENNNDSKSLIPKSLQNFLPYLLVGLAIALAVFAFFNLDPTGRKGHRLSENFIYKADSLSKIPKHLVSHQISRQIATGLKIVTAIGVDNKERIFVAGDGKINVYNIFGKRIFRFLIEEKTEEGSVNENPTCLFAENDEIFVGFKNRIMIFTLSGKKKKSWKRKISMTHFTSIAAKGNNIFVADAGSRTVLHYNRRGTLLKQIDGRNNSGKIKGFIVPSPYFDIAILDKKLIVANPGWKRIETYNFQGKLIASWKKETVHIDGFLGCCNPSHISILPDGNIVTSEKGITRIKIYDPKGKLISIVAGPKKFRNNTQACDVAAGQNGRVYILDRDKKYVKIFSPLSK